MAEVKINSFGFAYVPMYIRNLGSSAMQYLSYKVDSGANRTTISKKWLNELGCSDEWIKSGILLEGEEKPTVATGEPIGDCYKVSVPEINIGGFVGYNWPFIVSLNTDIQFRLLFGVDSMRFFNWTFDYENGVCRFDLIPEKRELRFNQKEQTIHAIEAFDEY